MKIKTNIGDLVKVPDHVGKELIRLKLGTEVKEEIKSVPEPEVKQSKRKKK